MGKRQGEALGREVDLVTDIVKNVSRAIYGYFIIDSLQIVHPLLSAAGMGSPATLPVAIEVMVNSGSWLSLRC